MAPSHLGLGLMLMAGGAMAGPFPGFLFQLPGIESGRECRSDYEPGDTIWNEVTMRVDCCSHHVETKQTITFDPEGGNGMVIHSQSDESYFVANGHTGEWRTDFLALSFEPTMKRFVIAMNTRAQIRAVGEHNTRRDEDWFTSSHYESPTQVDYPTDLEIPNDNPGLVWWDTVTDCHIDECSLELWFNDGSEVANNPILEDVSFLGPVTSQQDRHAFGHLGSFMRYPGFARLYGQHPFVLPGFLSSHDVQDVVEINDGLKMKINLGPLFAPLVNLGTENRFVDVDGFMFGFGCPPIPNYGDPAPPCAEALVTLEDGFGSETAFRHFEDSCANLALDDCGTGFTCVEDVDGSGQTACYKCEVTEVDEEDVCAPRESTCENVAVTRPEEWSTIDGGYPCGGEMVRCPLGWKLGGDDSACYAPEAEDKDVPPATDSWYADEWSPTPGQPDVCPDVKLYWPQHDHFMTDLERTDSYQINAVKSFPVEPDYISIDEAIYTQPGFTSFWTPCRLQTSQEACESSYFFAPESLTHHRCEWGLQNGIFKEPICTGPIRCNLQYYPSIDSRTVLEQFQSNNNLDDARNGHEYEHFSEVTLTSIIGESDCNVCIPGPPPRRCSLWGNDETMEPCFSSTCHSPHCTSIPRPWNNLPNPSDLPDPQVCCPIGHWDLWDSEHINEVVRRWFDNPQGDNHKWRDKLVDWGFDMDTPPAIVLTERWDEIHGGFGIMDNDWDDVDDKREDDFFGATHGTLWDFVRPRGGHLALVGDRSACGFYDVREQCAFWGNNEGNPGSATKECRDDDDCYSGKCHEYSRGKGRCLLERCGCSVVPEGEAYEFQTVCCPVEARELDDKTDNDMTIVRFFPSPSDRSRCVSTDPAPKVCSLWNHDEHTMPRCYTADPIIGDFGPSIALEMVLNYDVADDELDRVGGPEFHYPSPRGNGVYRQYRRTSDRGIADGGFHRLDALNQMYTCTIIPDGEFNAGRQVCCPVDLDLDFENTEDFGTGVTPIGVPRRVPRRRLTSLGGPGGSEAWGAWTGLDNPTDVPQDHYGDHDNNFDMAWRNAQDSDTFESLWDYRPRSLIGDGSACSGPKGQTNAACGLWGNPDLPICDCGSMSLVSFMPLTASSLTCALDNFPDQDWCRAHASEEPFGPHDKCCGTVPDDQPCPGMKICCPPGMTRWGDGSSCTGGKYFDAEANAFKRREDCALWDNFPDEKGRGMPRCADSANYQVVDKGHNAPADLSDIVNENLPGPIIPQGRKIPSGQPHAGKAVCCPPGYELYHDYSACRKVGKIGTYDSSLITDPADRLLSYGLNEEARDHLLANARRQDDVQKVRCVDDPTYVEYHSATDATIWCDDLAAALNRDECWSQGTAWATGDDHYFAPMGQFNDHSRRLTAHSYTNANSGDECGWWGRYTEDERFGADILALGCFADDAHFYCARTCARFFAAAGLVDGSGGNYHESYDFCHDDNVDNGVPEYPGDACWIWQDIGVNEDIEERCPLPVTAAPTKFPTPAPTSAPSSPTPQPSFSPGRR